MLGVPRFEFSLCHSYVMHTSVLDSCLVNDAFRTTFPGGGAAGFVPAVAVSVLSGCVGFISKYFPIM